MDYRPSSDEFTATYKGGKPQIVWTTLTTDLETPVSAMMKLQGLSPYHLLFESVQGGERRGRYSILALDPDVLWKCDDGQVSLCRDIEADEWEIDARPVFESLRTLLAESAFDVPAELPSMAAGVFGYMGYDMVKLMEELPDNNPKTIDIPDGLYMRPQTTVVFDAVRDEAFIHAIIYPCEGLSADAAYAAAKVRLDTVVETLKSTLKQSIYDRYYATDKQEKIEFKSHIDKAAYCEMVEVAKDYIVAGDIFQIVPSRRLSAPFALPPLALYRSLRHLNPSPYLFYVHLDGMSLVGSSPEILVKCEGDTVTIRPIAGTRHRGKTEAEDKALEKELLEDVKERAEHLMLLDLGRNDVGRVAQDDTVRVTESFIVERYSHVMHIVSNVEGKLRADKDAIDALIAGFPAGTVSGAPKIRAMEIIDELEPEKRSFYSGTVGYFAAGGDMDTCIALRTGLVKDDTLYIQAGGGVVADSVPESEFIETENKAGALMSAAAQASKFAETGS